MHTFRSIFAAVDDDTVVFVFGDHGMTASGDHGGESEMETTAALLVLTPRPLFDPQQVGKRRRGFLGEKFGSVRSTNAKERKEISCGFFYRLLVDPRIVINRVQSFQYKGEKEISCGFIIHV